MFSFRSLWSRHKKKVFVTLGIAGSGYFLYKLYDAHKRRLDEVAVELAAEREHDERIKAQMQYHFETIQRIADTTTLPRAMHYLSNRINEELNLSVLTEILKQGKDVMTLPEKLELWDKLKVLSFTKMVLSLWSVTMISLFVRVQVNILGRHLYIDIARSQESSPLIEEATFTDQDDEQNFLAKADYLASHGLPALIFNMQAAAAEILKNKQLKDVFNSSILHETVVQILYTFMSMGRPHHWIEYLMAEDAKLPSLTPSMSSNNLILADGSKFDQLMKEAHSVLSSDEFTHVVEVSLKTVVNAIVNDIFVEQSGSGTPSSSIALVKLVPRIAQTSQVILDEPTTNQFVQTIKSIQDVELFFTILYANASTV
ncbi:peroxisome biogenesis protein 3-2-like [Amaranthus tricolor]|uniref:peroxisome biogenesis protein 3-2-like n=1 Tax=Amaranthus tricolor TaxID=29722 RepID=UPI0025868581|nr:peroxisome biogenesis protein 3-2-like [Amaranthus tricolor]